MASPDRTYDEALFLLEKLQSNRAVVNMVQESDKDMNLDAIPEMLTWVRKAGYTAEDFNSLKVVHVAGTKGKGSVSAMAASILKQYSTGENLEAKSEGSKSTAAKFISPKGAVGNVGLYTSPHLVTVRERIRINSELISEQLFASHFFTLWDRFSESAAAAGHPDPTSPETKPGYFRYLTVMALHVFLQEGVQTAVVECGIGGEYDSTNIFTKESVTVTAITKLGIDHVGMLGNTIEKIAWHKGGIMKENVPCFTLRQEPEAMQVLSERATEKAAVLNVVERRPDIESGELKVRLEGDFQKENASLAVAVVSEHLKQMGLDYILRGGKLPAEFRKGLEEVEWEGRCEVRREGNIEWCIDGAHTMESVKATADWFGGKLQGRNMGQAMLIFNQQDRDPAALVRALHFSLEQATGARHIFSNAAFCTNIPFKARDGNVFGLGDRMDYLGVQKLAADALSDFESDAEIEVYSSVEEAVEKAREISQDRQKLHVLVTGSLHLVGSFIRVLQKTPPAL